MIPVKEAVARAAEFARTILEPPRTADLLLEEVEATTLDGKDVWLVTLSMPHGGSLSLGDALSSLSSELSRAREYKTFTVHGETGEILSMKIREVAGVR